jgi:hypothetical protein
MDVVQHAEAWNTAHPAGSHFRVGPSYDPHDPYEPRAALLADLQGSFYDGEIAYADSRWSLCELSKEEAASG